MESMILKPAARYPADPRAVFILALSVFSGVTALLLQVGPQSLEALLPSWAIFVWGGLLALGSLVTLAGMALQTVNGIIIEQIGSVMVGATTIFYSILAFEQHGASSLQGVGIVLAWGLACFIRWAQLQVLINDAQRRAERRVFLERLEAEIEARADRERKRESLRRLVRHEEHQ